MTHACRCRTTSVRRCVPEHRPGRADAVRGLDHAAPAGPSRAARAGSPVGRHRGYGRAPRAWPGEVHGAGRLVKAARSEEGYEALVTQFQKGAPRWSPMSWADESLNFIEYVIHIEDVRRGGDTPLSPRV